MADNRVRNIPMISSQQGNCAAHVCYEETEFVRYRLVGVGINGLGIGLVRMLRHMLADPDVTVHAQDEVHSKGQGLEM